MTSAPKVLLIAVLCLAAGILCGQDLTPRAYLITPTGSNAVGFTYSFSGGSVLSDPTIPLTDFKARIHAQVFSYYRAISFLGRSANVAVALPYAFGNLKATTATGIEGRLYRSGLADLRIRFSANLRGAPAMNLKEFMEWREKTTLGASVTVAIPTGQYDRARLINTGNRRWAVKPELGLSRRYGRWTVDLYGGVWLFTANARFFPGDSTRTQAPVAATEAHLVRHLTRRCWLSVDGNYWMGGRTTVNGTQKFDYQRNSRAGATAAIPLNRRQALKFSYSRGAYISIGGNYHNVSMAWQYSWLGRPW